MIELTSQWDDTRKEKVIIMKCSDSAIFSKFLSKIPKISDHSYKKKSNYIIVNKLYFQDLYDLYKKNICLSEFDQKDSKGFVDVYMRAKIENFIVNDFPEEYKYFSDDTKNKIIQSQLDKNLQLKVSFNNVNNQLQQANATIQQLRNSQPVLGQNSNQFFQNNFLPNLNHQQMPFQNNSYDVNQTRQPSGY